MNMNEITVKNETSLIESSSTLTGRAKRAHYMSQLRGPVDSEYRRIERENNARAMRRKRLENSAYREHERRQNRVHMAELRRDNPEYRQKEHLKNRHRMALKRSVSSPNTSKISSNDPKITLQTNNSNRNITENVLNSIYQTLEHNLQAAHISFIPYQSSCSFQSDNDQQQQQQQLEKRTNTKRRTEFDLFQQVDEYCRQQEMTCSSSDSSSRSIASSTSSC